MFVWKDENKNEKKAEDGPFLKNDNLRQGREQRSSGYDKRLTIIGKFVSSNPIAWYKVGAYSHYFCKIVLMFIKTKNKGKRSHEYPILFCLKTESIEMRILNKLIQVMQLN